MASIRYHSHPLRENTRSPSLYLTTRYEASQSRRPIGARAVSFLSLECRCSHHRDASPASGGVRVGSKPSGQGRRPAPGAQREGSSAASRSAGGGQRHAQPGLERRHPARALLTRARSSGSLSAPRTSASQAACCRSRGPADDEVIDAGPHALAHELFDREAVGHRLHAQIVAARAGPSSPAAAAAAPGRSAADSDAGRTGSKAGKTTWATISDSASACTAAANGASSTSTQAPLGVADHRQVVVRIEIGVAVTGEVFPTSEHTGAAQPPPEGQGVGDHRGGVRAEGPPADHRVGRVGVHVEHGGEVPADPQQRQLAPQRPPDGEGALRDRRRLPPTSCRATRSAATAAAARPPFLVHRDRQRGRWRARPPGGRPPAPPPARGPPRSGGTAPRCPPPTGPPGRAARPGAAVPSNPTHRSCPQLPRNSSEVTPLSYTRTPETGLTAQGPLPQSGPGRGVSDGKPGCYNVPTSNRVD